MDKTELRRSYKKIRNNITDEQRQAAGQLITDKITAMSVFNSCDTLFCFIACGSEIPTQPLIEAAFECGKKVAVPRVMSKTEMVFIYITSLDGLETSAYGIPEPVYDESKKAVPTADSLIIVPGLVFDKRLYRIGYGGGYYDRYTSAYPQALKIGAAFDRQYTEDELPRDKFDKPVDLLVTSDGKIRENERKKL